MNSYFTFSEAQQRTLISQTAARVGLPEQAVEKDLWVTVILQAVFALPYAGKLIFKGGTTLAKAGLISRFSEDIDLAIDRTLFGIEEDLTKKKLKGLRKQSSLFVKDTLAEDLRRELETLQLGSWCSIEPEPDGEGDLTYPEPRKIHVRYRSLFLAPLAYLRPEVLLEIGARSLIEPWTLQHVQSFIASATGVKTAPSEERLIPMADPRKTFLEKAFLLHEQFSTGAQRKADRQSRHLYDLEKMMQRPDILAAIHDDALWASIAHHRAVFTSVAGFDYNAEIRDHIVLVPPESVLADWQADYQTMCQSMIFEPDPLSFDALIERLHTLESLFRHRR